MKHAAILLPLVLAALLLTPPLLTANAGVATFVQNQPVRRTPAARPTVGVSPGTATRPIARPTALATLAQTPALPTRGAFLATVAPVAPASLPTALPRMTPQVTVAAVTRVAEYAAADAIRAFAQQHLGLVVAVTHAAGATGSASLPVAVQDEVAAAAAMAGQVSLGAITAGSARGAAQVAVGSGSISGDLQADIEAASLGAYSLVVATPAPRSSSAARDLIRTIFPALTAKDLVQTSGIDSGYIFVATESAEGLDPRTLTVTAAIQEVMAGVTGQGRSSVVWVVLANGDLAAALTLP